MLKEDGALVSLNCSNNCANSVKRSPVVPHNCAASGGMYKGHFGALKPSPRDTPHNMLLSGGIHNKEAGRQQRCQQIDIESQQKHPNGIVLNPGHHRRHVHGLQNEPCKLCSGSIQPLSAVPGKQQQDQQHLHQLLNVSFTVIRVP